uniref:Uncharacterized protein n=1 Tax=Lactuca sativa TaxID=4236 RepID=A0A9R1W1H3_LACSA|nr:hypothetical protein LSAT_V11C300119100 [Lactuca sativa]
MMIKYLFKYISKGADRVRYTIQKAEQPDESTPVITSGNQDAPQNPQVKNFLDGRYICPHEAAWRILNFHIHLRHPPVQVLSVHEENMQQLLFKEDSTIPEVLSNPYNTITTLVGWFRSNTRDPAGRHLNTQKLINGKSLSSPGALGLMNLRTVSGTIYPTFRAACNALNLIGDDAEWLTAFTEASVWATSP